MKKRRTSNIPLSLRQKILPLHFYIFWKFVDCIQMAGRDFPLTFQPTAPYGSSYFQCDAFSDFLKEKKKEKLKKMMIGSLVACVFTSKHHQIMPMLENLAEIQSSKIRTFFGHIIQKREKDNNTSLFLRVSIAHELFLFRIFPYAPNILSFFVIRSYTGNLRSSFYYKVLQQQKNLRASRSGNV